MKYSQVDYSPVITLSAYSISGGILTVIRFNSMPVAASAVPHGSEDWTKVLTPEEGLELWKTVIGIGDVTAQALVDADFWMASAISALADKDFVRATFAGFTAGMCVNVSEAAKAWFPGSGTPRSVAYGSAAHGATSGGAKLSAFPAWPTMEGWPSVDEQRVIATRIKGWAAERPHLMD